MFLFPVEVVAVARDKQPGIADQVREVFAYWRKFHPQAFPKPHGDSKEWKKIRDRLREGYTVAQLCRAIDGMHKSPFHCGENDRGRKYLSLELCMRDGDHVAMFIEIAAEQEAGVPVLSEKTKRTIRAGQSWLARKSEGGGDVAGISQ